MGWYVAFTYHGASRIPVFFFLCVLVFQALLLAEKQETVRVPCEECRVSEIRRACLRHAFARYKPSQARLEYGNVRETKAKRGAHQNTNASPGITLNKPDSTTTTWFTFTSTPQLSRVGGGAASTTLYRYNIQHPTTYLYLLPPQRDASQMTPAQRRTAAAVYCCIIAICCARET